MESKDEDLSSFDGTEDLGTSPKASPSRFIFAGAGLVLAALVAASVFLGGDTSIFAIFSSYLKGDAVDFVPLLEIGICEIVLFLASLAEIVLELFKKKGARIPLLVIGIAGSFLGAAFSFPRGLALTGGLSAGAATVALASLIYASILQTRESREHPENKPENQLKEHPTFVRVSEIVTAVLTFAAVVSCFFLPLFGVEDNMGETVLYRIGDALSPSCSDILIVISFVVLLLVALFMVLGFSKNLANMFPAPKKFIRKNKNLLYAGLATTLVFYMYGVILAKFVYTGSAKSVYTANAVPFLCCALFVVLESVFSARSLPSGDDEGKEFRFSSRVTVLIISLVESVLAMVSSLTDILRIEVSPNSGGTFTTYVNGLDVLEHYQEMGDGYQVLAFLIFVCIIVVSLFLVFELATFFRKSRSYYRVASVGIIVTYLFIFALFLFGFYYQIAEKINEEMIVKFLNYMGYTISNIEDYTGEIVSTTLTAPYFFGATALMLVLAIAKPFTKHIQEESVNVNIKSAEGLADAEKTLPNKGESPLTNGGNTGEIDPCPAFLEIDLDEPARIEAHKAKESAAFENPTLVSLTDFVIDYAKNSRLHLTYNREMIASFLAGLGDSKLTILQGMSGTGKTSLPKIFCEAIMGDCRIVEVESSWKDKNELIGYYNEFTKLFTPKKFVQALYASTLARDDLSLIVLDEMNLSRIEYYFSDFLSLMENEPDKRTFRVVNVPLFYQKDGKPTPFLGLEKGHTIRITPNIWFIGTANRDESTFEISDKVYDRANTLNFDKRAPKAVPDKGPLSPRYLSYAELQKLFDGAKASSNFSLTDVPYLSKAEALLAPYNISYGNRIANQMEDFVKIYCACFKEGKEREHEALETIFLSKVVHKLEYKTVENKEELSEEFARLGLKQCADFIAHLSEDQ